MSVYGSVKTNFSVSEMSLASSALMTAQSSYTFSDGDYETSSELLSPRTVTNENFEISRCSSSLHCSADTNYNGVCPLNSSILDDGEESFMSYEASKCGFTVKSESCLSQQEKAISKFMDDVLRVQVQHAAEPNLSVTKQDSIDPVSSKTVPITNSLDSPKPEIDINCGDSLNSKFEECNDLNFSKLMQEKGEHKFGGRENMCDNNCANESSFHETKNKIMENLAQVTCDKLFAKSGLRHLNSINYCPSIIKTKEQTASQVNPIIKKTVTSQKSQFSRRSLRSIGVESLLRIDHELQPLNLMLSKLLAEFRAMTYRERLNYDDSSSFYSTSCFRIVDRKHFQRFGNHEPSLESYAKSSVTDEAKSVNKETENYSSIKKEKDTFVNFLQCEQRTRSTSMSHELLSEDQATSDTKSSSRTSRSYQSSSIDSPNSRREKSQSRVKTLRKRRSHSYKKGTGRSERQNRREDSGSFTVAPRQEETPGGGGGGGGDDAILAEIGPAALSCIGEQPRAEGGDGRAKSPEVGEAVARGTEDGEAPGKKNENESSTLLHLRSEKTEAGVGFGVSCRQLISLSEHRAFLAQLRAAVGGEGAGDSISATDEVPVKQTRDSPQNAIETGLGESTSAGGDVGDETADDCTTANFHS